MGEWDRVERRRREAGGLTTARARQQPSAAFGVGTAEGILALQRMAGNRAAVAFVERRQEASFVAARAVGPPTVPTVPTVQRGVRSFIGGVAKAAGSYVADVGRGFKRSAKGLRFWNPDALVKMNEENVSAAKLFAKLVSEPKATLLAALSAAGGGLTTWASLPDSLKDKAKGKFKDKAPAIVEGVIAKALGKALAQYAFVRLANKILTSALVKQLLKKLGASAIAAKSGVGIPLAVFSSLGLIEKASAAADRLQKRFPELYRRLEAEDLHLLWFVIEPHVPEILDEVHAAVNEYIDRTTPEGRVLVNAGGGDDRTPIDSGPRRRVPINSGGG